MARSSRDLKPDRDVQSVLDAFAGYEVQHAGGQIEAYRQNSASIRIRIIDPDFEGIDRVQREELAWSILERLPEPVQSQITVLLLLTPKEASFSFASYEFDNPLPSRL